MREVITLQVGPYANWTGAHYWNLQNEVNALIAAGVAPEVDLDVQFRTGQTSRGELTYTPRMLCCDLQENLGWMRSAGNLEPEEDDDHASQTSSPAWSGPVQHIVAERVNPSRYIQALGGKGSDAPLQADPSNPDDSHPSSQEIEQSARHWADYANVQVHQQSMCTLPSSMYASEDGTTTLDSASSCMELAKSCWGDEFLERVRWFSEECDAMQGFYAFCDATGSLSFLAGQLLEHIRDEYGPATPIIGFSLCPPRTPRPAAVQKRQDVRAALGVASLASNLSLMVPLDAAPRLPHLTACDLGRWYQASAVHAAALDALTVGTRLQLGAAAGGGSLSTLVNSLRTKDSFRLASASTGIPLPVIPGATLGQALSGGHPTWHASMAALSPIAHSRRSAFFSQHCVVRGWPGNLTENAADLAASCSRLPCASTSVTLTSQPLLLPAPFPQFFDSQIGPVGELLYPRTIADSASQVTTIAVLAHMAADPFLKPWMENLVQQLSSRKSSMVLALDGRESVECAAEASLFLTELAEDYD